MSRKSAALAALMVLFATQNAPAQPVPASLLPRIFIEDTTASSVAGRVADALGATRSIAIGSRVVVTLPDATLNDHLTALAARKLPAWVAVVAPTTVEAIPAWQSALRELFARHSSAIGIIEVVVSDQSEALRRFALQVAATEARSQSGTTRVAMGTADDIQAEEIATSLTKDYAPYLDLIVVPADADTAKVSTAALNSIPTVGILRRGLSAGDSALEARTRLVRDVLTTVGTSTLASAWRGAPEALTDAVRALAPAADLLAHQVEAIDAAAAAISITQAGRDATGAVAFRLLFDQETFATYLVYESLPSSQPIEVALRLAIAGAPVVLDLTTGDRLPMANYVRDDEAARSRGRVPLTGRPMLVNYSEGAEQIVIDRAAVSADRQLSVEEVIARHRQYQTRHDTLLKNYRASARMEQHFRPSLTDPGFDVVTENQYFVDDGGVEWEERSFSVNGSKWGSDRPAFPILQPEKVLSLPLELRLNTDYRYTLTGTERIGVFDCYRVRFEPTRESESLYRGTVWIDRRTFGRVRIQAVQTRTSAPIVSNEETHEYEAVADLDGFPMLLLTRLTARQIVLIAGRNLLLEKAATFSDFRLNSPDFVEVRENARRGERVMYRDTERGVRYLVKEGEARVVSERATASARAMAMGVLVDPSFGFPLPIFGINYLDFEFRGRPDTQFALLFGGVLAAGNLQRPKLGGTPLDASIDFFGIAAPASDRVYVAGGERERERLLTWPLTTGLNLGWQYTAFQKVQFQYQFRFDPFVRDRTTDETYVVPSSTFTQGLGGAWEYKRGGYSVALNGTYFARGSWRPWGPVDALESNPPRTYLKYAAHISRDFFFNVFHKVHLNASHFGGQRLDRFSRYQFGLFDDTRIHGVPASGVRFDTLSMVRGSYSFNIFEQYRLDLFAEQAWGRDQTVDNDWQPVTGLGIAVNLRAPWNTILRADVGKSLLPARYREVGSTVFQIMLLKPLK